MRHATYTPGPWKWHEGDEGGHTRFLAPADYESGDDQILYHGSDWPISEQDARLIASAPELLYALQELVKEVPLSKLNVRKDFSLMNAHAYASKIIHKATGRQAEE